MKFRPKKILRYAKEMGYIDENHIHTFHEQKCNIDDYLKTKISLKSAQRTRVYEKYIEKSLLKIMQKKGLIDQNLQDLWEKTKKKYQQDKLPRISFLLENIYSRKEVFDMASLLLQRKFFTEEDIILLQKIISKNEREEQIFLDSAGQNKYLLLEKIGAGGYGKVYLGKNIHNNQNVAIKLLHKDFPSESHKKRFLQEAKTLSTLKHKNIVELYEFPFSRNIQNFYIVMEYIEGFSLKEKLSDGVIEESFALDITITLCETLDFTMQRNIIHRDVKPANILIDTTKNCIKLVDFGVSKILGTDMTETGTNIGSINYAAPEQIENAKYVDHRADIYTLGTTLYNILTNNIPFHECANPHAVLWAKMSKDYLSLANDINISSATKKIIEHCTNKDPAQRYQTFFELKTALKESKDKLNGRQT